MFESVCFLVDDEDENLKEKLIVKGKFKFQMKRVKGFNCSVSEDDGLYVDDESNFIIEGELDFFFFCYLSIVSEFDLVISFILCEDNFDGIDFNV